MKNENHIIMKIEDLPGGLIVYPQYYINNGLYVANELIRDIPNKLKTVEELRDDLVNHPENEQILNNVLKSIFVISIKKLYGLNECKEEIEEIYNSINNLDVLNAYALCLNKKKRK